MTQSWQHSSSTPSTTPEAGSDADLVRLAQLEPARFALLYERYRGPILTYCAVRLRDRTEAEDAASTIFIKALNALPRYAERGHAFRSWLFAIAHNEITDRQRQQRYSCVSIDLALHIPDPGLSPEEASLSTDEREHLHTLLALLPARERSVLELRAAGCQTHEIARILQITEMSVRTAQSRGLRRLRDHLAPATAQYQEIHHA
jgi:RNA polymerase sigma-70 factor (ECF subfamily)